METSTILLQSKGYNPHLIKLDSCVISPYSRGHLKLLQMFSLVMDICINRWAKRKRPPKMGWSSCNPRREKMLLVLSCILYFIFYFFCCIFVFPSSCVFQHQPRSGYALPRVKHHRKLFLFFLSFLSYVYECTKYKERQKYKKKTKLPFISDEMKRETRRRRERKKVRDKKNWQNKKYRRNII